MLAGHVLSVDFGKLPRRAHLGLSSWRKQWCLSSLSICFPWDLPFTLVVSILSWSFSSLFPFESSKIVPPITHVHSLWFHNLSQLFLLMWTLSVKWCLSLITLQLVGNFLLKSSILIKPIAGSFGIITTNPAKPKTELDLSFSVSSLTPSPPPTEIFPSYLNFWGFMGSICCLLFS